LFYSEIRSVSFEIAYRVTLTNHLHLNNIPKQATLLLSPVCIEFWYCLSFVALLNFLSRPLHTRRIWFLNNWRYILHSDNKNVLLQGLRDIENAQNITNYTSMYTLVFLHIWYFTHLRTTTISLKTRISIFNLILHSSGKITSAEKN